MSQGSMVRVLACGSIDDGKSTLLGHLLCLTGNVPDDQRASLERESGNVNRSDGWIDYSLLLDGLTAEREQGITIDVAYRYFYAGGRKFILADTPGHEQYTRNMGTGASRCSAAILLVDATAGLTAQTCRHALICAMMGIGDLMFAINKMDLAGWSEERFRDLEASCGELAAKLEASGMGIRRWCALPVSAVHGDNLVESSARMPWFTRGATVLGWLLALDPEQGAEAMPLRLPVQYVLKARCEDTELWQKQAAASLGAVHDRPVYRAWCGTLASGTLRRGQSVVILPSATQATVAEIRCGERTEESAQAGMAVSVTFEGEHDIVRGDCIAARESRLECSSVFKVRLVWMDNQPLFAGRQYVFRSVFGTATAEVTQVRNVISLALIERLAADHLAMNDTGEVEIAISRDVPFDLYSQNRTTGGFILINRGSNQTAACGMILHAMRRASNVHRQSEDVTREERAVVKGQRPRVLWLTGLSGAGKSTIANRLERRLWQVGRHTMLLDGDNVRHGLNRDLGFTEADRVENIRRIGEVAKLMTDSGMIVITAFISPYYERRSKNRPQCAA